MKAAVLSVSVAALVPLSNIYKVHRSYRQTERRCLPFTSHYSEEIMLKASLKCLHEVNSKCLWYTVLAPAHQPVVNSRCFRCFNGVKWTGVFFCRWFSLAFTFSAFLTSFSLSLSRKFPVNITVTVYSYEKARINPLGGLQPVSSLLIIH